MRRQSPADKLAKKRAALLSRTAAALDIGTESANGLLRTGRRQSVRLNPLAGDRQETLQKMERLGWQGTGYGWMSDGYTIEAGLEALRDSQLATDGKLIIQNAASWLPVLALGAQSGDRVLDVCAAPGGKTTHIAALTANGADIVANDNSRARLMKLQAMCARMQADIARYTLYDAQYLARKLDGERFDRILLDAACSGEGMMHLDRDKDFTTWSVAQIKRLQQLQKKMLVQAWQLLKPGGVLVYSTCTMAPEEDEAVIDYALRALEDVRLDPWHHGMPELPNRVPAVMEWNGKAFNPEVAGCLRLRPDPWVEAFFVCRLTKRQD